MSIGKYSPTVSAAYDNDQDWWTRNDIEFESLVDMLEFNDRCPNGLNYDNDGYDSYGYNEDNVDRAGNTEDEYAVGEDSLTGNFGKLVYPLYDYAIQNWGIDSNGFPILQNCD